MQIPTCTSSKARSSPSAPSWWSSCSTSLQARSNWGYKRGLFAARFSVSCKTYGTHARAIRSLGRAAATHALRPGSLNLQGSDAGISTLSCKVLTNKGNVPPYAQRGSQQLTRGRYSAGRASSSAPSAGLCMRTCTRSTSSEVGSLFSCCLRGAGRRGRAGVGVSERRVRRCCGRAAAGFSGVWQLRQRQRPAAAPCTLHQASDSS